MMVSGVCSFFLSRRCLAKLKVAKSLNGFIVSPLSATWSAHFSSVHQIIVARWVKLSVCTPLESGCIETYTDSACCYSAVGRGMNCAACLSDTGLHSLGQSLVTFIWWGGKEERKTRAGECGLLKEAHQFDSDFLPLVRKREKGAFQPINFQPPSTS